MYSKVTPTFLLLSITLLIWFGSTALSEYLATSIGRAKHEHGGKDADGNINLSLEIKNLLDSLENNPNDIQALLTLGTMFEKEATRVSDPTLIMRAVDSYRNVLEIDKSNLHALKALGNISFSFGVYERAENYFKSYLTHDPNNLQVKNDYALSLLQNGDSENAYNTLTDILLQDETFIPARLSLAFYYKEMKDFDKALEQAKLALEFSKDEETSNSIKRIITVVSNAAGDKDTTQILPSDMISPASLITAYFHSHPILSTKLVQIQWQDRYNVHVYLEDFPVENMPKYAKDSFIENLQSEFAEIQDPIYIHLLDAIDKHELLSVQIGVS
jgi:tetratricopeptide (TPR) repeat protein